MMNLKYDGHLVYSMDACNSPCSLYDSMSIYLVYQFPTENRLPPRILDP